MTLPTLKRRVRTWQLRNGLADWAIEVRIVQRLRAGGRPCHAVTACVDQRATISFDADTLTTLDKDGLDHLICHELQHIIDDPQEDVFLSFLGGTKGTFYRAWEKANESACDQRASNIVNAYKRKRDRHSK